MINTKIMTAIASILGIFSFLWQGTEREARFWQWFQKHQDEIYSIQGPEDDAFNKLAHEIQTVYPDLAFQLGAVENGQREFILSADGLKRAFPAVESLAKAAPPMPRWKVTTFRPRQPELTGLKINGVTIAPDDVAVSCQSSLGSMNVTLFLGDPQLDEEIRGNMGFLFLDQTLGEYDVETYLGTIEFKPANAPSSLPKVSLVAFQKQFDEFKKHVK